MKGPKECLFCSHSNLNLTTDTEVTSLGFPIVGLHDTYSRSFQQPFGYTINKQANKHNTQWLQMGIQGWESRGKMEECLELNVRQLFVWVDCNLEEWEHGSLTKCFVIGFMADHLISPQGINKVVSHFVYETTQNGHNLAHKCKPSPSPPPPTPTVPTPPPHTKCRVRNPLLLCVNKLTCLLQIWFMLTEPQVLPTNRFCFLPSCDYNK